MGFELGRGFKYHTLDIIQKCFYVRLRWNNVDNALKLRSVRSVAITPLYCAMANSLSVWKYDAFLSFRGTDVRKKFISHLNDALTEEGIITFHDDRDLERGNPILKGLEEAMNQSRFAIVVVSEDYATSQWCLRELAFMVELAEKKRFDLIPIFYEIDPSALKSRTGCFTKAFEDHEQRFDAETVTKWRKAVAIVANISGWDSKTRFLFNQYMLCDI